MPLVTVTGGPTPPAGRTIATGTRLTVRYDEAYSDGASTYPQTYEAEWDATNSRWKPLGAADGTLLQIPAGADGYPRPPGAWLTELQVLDDASQQVSRRGPLRIYETTAGQWFYGSPASDAIFVSNPDVPGASAVLQTEVAVANGVASLDGAGDVPVGQIPDLSAIYAALTGATFTGDIRRGPASAESRISAGYMELTNNAPYPFIDFRATDAVDFGARVYLSGGDLQINGADLNMPNNNLRVAGNPVVEYGGTAAGRWYRFYDGTQIVALHYLELPYADSSSCRATWTFPVAFVDNVYGLQATIRGSSSGTSPSSAAATAAPSTAMLGPPTMGYIAATSVAIAVHRQEGQTNFNPGESLYVEAVAVGRWY